MHDLQTIIAMNAEKKPESTYTDAKEAMAEENAGKAQSYDFGGSSDLRVHHHAYLEKPKAELKNWKIFGKVHETENLREGFMVAVGDIYNDGSHGFPDGMDIRTSMIVNIDLKTMTIETLNTIYKLI